MKDLITIELNGRREGFYLIIIGDCMFPLTSVRVSGIVCLHLVTTVQYVTFVSLLLLLLLLPYFYAYTTCGIRDFANCAGAAQYIQVRDIKNYFTRIVPCQYLYKELHRK